MKVPTIAIAALLILISSYGYLYANPTPDPETGVAKISPTTFIPGGIGVLLLLCGVLSFADGLRKHVMHLAAMIGLFGFLGGIGNLVRVAMKPEPFDINKLSVQSTIAMTVLCLVFVGLCVNSFIQARKAREGLAAEQAAGL